MTTYGLIHGAFHGAWCWERLGSELVARGHDALTVDLPCDDPEAGAAEYAAACLDAFARADDDLVLVAHSLGGLTAPLVAQARPASRIVYLCAMLPRPGRIHDDITAQESDMVLAPPVEGVTVDDQGVVRWSPEAAAAWFFADCTADDAAWAASQLRGQAWTITREMTPLDTWPPVPATYILGREDPVINPAWSRRVVPEVLGVAPVEIPGGHSPFLAVPAALADLLV